MIDKKAVDLENMKALKAALDKRYITDITGAVRFDEEQTLTEEQKLQARKNISAAAEEQALKNMYNLGAYDTFTDNGDGTATITRKTGYGDSVTEQTETATSYTEEVILDQPIHTLDVSGEQFVRDEWEKGLNLFNIDEANLSVTNNCSATKDDNGNITIVKTGSDPYINDLFHFYATSTKYTVSARSSKDMQIFVNINGTYSSSQIIPTPVFTFNCNIGDSIYLRLDGNDESSGNTQTFSDIMLVEGDHAYPYQPYNGKIVHENRVPLYFSDNNTSPASIFGGDWTPLGSFSSGGNTIYVWKKA